MTVLDIVDSANARRLTSGPTAPTSSSCSSTRARPRPTASSSFTDDATIFGNIVENTSADVDAILSGHTHLAYNCRYTVQDWVDETRAVTRRPVVSAGQYGTNLNQLVFNFDMTSGDLLEIEQELVGTAGVGYDADPDVQAIVDDAVDFADAMGNDVLGQMDAPFNRAVYLPSSGQTENRGGESTLGNLVAEVQRWATQLPAGHRVRHRVHEPGWSPGRHGRRGQRRVRDLTYRQAANVQPFANTLVNMDLTGAQIETVSSSSGRHADRQRPVAAVPAARASEASATTTRNPVTVNGPNSTR